MIGNKVNINTYKKQWSILKNDHAYPNTNLVRLEKWFLKIPGLVLDHGCGYGENLIFLTTKGYNVTAVDISEDLIEFVKIKCKLNKVPPTLFNLIAITGEESLPFEDKSFDHIISLGVLHLMGDKKTAYKCIQELIRCLKPRGKIIVSTQGKGNSHVNDAKPLGNESYFYEETKSNSSFDGTEKNSKDSYHKLALYIPDDDESFASLFDGCKVDEVGSWDNDYCGVKGKHLVALATKKHE
jgi:SAM-dependent methyltransferase